jgi:hypothetical protein
LLELVPAEDRGELLAEVVKSAMASALKDDCHRALAAFGTLLKSVPKQHHKLACLPADRDRQNNLIRACHVASPVAKSTFLSMLGEVDDTLAEQFTKMPSETEIQV